MIKIIDTIYMYDCVIFFTVPETWAVGVREVYGRPFEVDLYDDEYGNYDCLAQQIVAEEWGLA